jgi:hypothetical protein
MFYIYINIIIFNNNIIDFIMETYIIMTCSGNEVGNNGTGGTGGIGGPRGQPPKNTDILYVLNKEGEHNSEYMTNKEEENNSVMIFQHQKVYQGKRSVYIDKCHLR